MKKILLTLGAAFLLTAGAYAQGGLGYGLKAGVNIPSYSMEEVIFLIPSQRLTFMLLVI
ncbi:hypothetical protein OKW96_10915 [Sphingobacterium sp. KU25419]|nr:hypothetical protein OKW96_10915 [Sphingobacterium sp. KU25419]